MFGSIYFTILVEQIYVILIYFSNQESKKNIELIKVNNVRFFIIEIKVI